ncbi:carbon-nitrogen hydrolase family protein [uncultured Helicobacter sp.]|uniref:carbon-nitrogen hydrolase family protein n=1 Tax=uncultured Helicobacter sp. TaxID=175537 RepID=UPI00374FABB9
MRVALLQVSKVQSPLYLDSYFQNCAKQGVSLVVLPEYTFEPFFRHLQSLPSPQLVASHNVSILRELSQFAKQYKLEIITPIVVDSYTLKLSNNRLSNKFYKTIALIDSQGFRFYIQQRLISYLHWDEHAFFANKHYKRPKLPLTIEREGLKIGILSGFELHFDELFVAMKPHSYDVLIVPCANTFDSLVRWRSLCKTRAFLNSCVLLRVNRVGTEIVDQASWNFYGDSLYINAYGQIEDSLQDYEGLMIVSLRAESIHKAREVWEFHKPFSHT